MTTVYCDCYDCYNNDDNRCVLDSISLTFRMTGDGQRALCDLICRKEVEQMTRDEKIEKLTMFCNYKRQGCHYPDDCALYEVCHRRNFHTMEDEELETMCSIIKTKSEFTSTQIEIPAGATNGDMIKLLFPACHYALGSNHRIELAVNNGICSFDYDWWSAPYVK